MILCIVASMAAAQDISVSIGNAAGDAGETISVDVQLVLHESVGFSSLEMNLGGFQDLLQLQGIDTDGSVILENGWQIQYNNMADELLIAAAGSADISQSGHLFSLELLIPEMSPIGVVPIEFMTVIINNGEFEVDTNNGSVTVGCLETDCAGTCGGAAFMDDCGECVGGETGLAENWAMDCLGICYGPAAEDECGICDDDPGNDNLTCGGCTDETALNFDPDAVVLDDSCIYGLPGDLTQDGEVDILDVILLVSIILQYTEPTEYHFLAGNLYGDNQLSVSDLVLLVDMILNP